MLISFSRSAHFCFCFSSIYWREEKNDEKVSYHFGASAAYANQPFLEH